MDTAKGRLDWPRLVLTMAWVVGFASQGGCAHGPTPSKSAPARHDTYAFLAVVAHPDDDAVFLADAIFQLSHHRHLKGALVVLTDGAKGGSRLGFELDAELAALRERELARAAAIYGVDAFFLGFPDWGVMSTPEQILSYAWGESEPVRLLVELLRALRPAVVLSSHPQHSVGHAAHRAAARLLQQAVLKAADARFEPNLGEPFGVARHFANGGRDDAGPFVVDTAPFFALRRAVSAAYQSQWSPGSFADAPPLWHFRLLHGRAQGKDLLDGLDVAPLPHHSKDAQRALRAGGFVPKTTRLYEGGRGARLYHQQRARLAANEGARGAYSFEKSPALITPAMQPPNVDADLAEYTDASPISLRDVVAGAAAKVHLLWHATGLFGGVWVQQEGVINSQGPQTLWRGDCLELLINGDASTVDVARSQRNAGDRQFIIAPTSGDGSARLVGVTAGGIRVPSAQVASRIDGFGYRLEFFIPASALAGWNPMGGSRLRFDVALNRVLPDGTRHKIAWHDTTRTAWCCPDSWGVARLLSHRDFYR